MSELFIYNIHRLFWFKSWVHMTYYLKIPIINEWGEKSFESFVRVVFLNLHEIFFLNRINVNESL
jgi:hypothetical protein